MVFPLRYCVQQSPQCRGVLLSRFVASGLTPLSILALLLSFWSLLGCMHNVESQQRIVKPFPSRQTIPCRADWTTDFKAYGSTSNCVYELRRTQAVTYLYLAFPMSTQHPSLLLMPRHNLLTIRKHWELESSSFENMVHLLLISILCW